MNSKEKDAGLSEDQLKTDVELRLRKAHLHVVERNSRVAYLYVNVQAMPTTNSRLWVFHVGVELQQPVSLVRDRSISCMAETWNQRELATTTADDLVSDVRRIVGDLEDEFINDYLAANPWAM